MALVIIITSLVIVSGLLKIFSEKNRESLGQNFEEMKNWFSIPSVLNSSKATVIQTPNQIVMNDDFAENSKIENSFFSDDEKYINDYNPDHTLEQNKLNKKVIVYKSVTKRMTLVKVY